MSKPYGMTAAFQIVRPSRAQDKIHEAVEEAIISGMSVKDFIRNAWESWEIVQDENKKFAAMDFKDALK